ncbi:hypothetical protein ACFL1H_02005 [Nanoarchaeota archaeon]
MGDIIDYNDLPIINVWNVNTSKKDPTKINLNIFVPIKGDLKNRTNYLFYEDQKYDIVGLKLEDKKHNGKYNNIILKVRDKKEEFYVNKYEVKKVKKDKILVAKSKVEDVSEMLDLETILKNDVEIDIKLCKLLLINKTNKKLVFTEFYTDFNIVNGYIETNLI